MKVLLDTNVLSETRKPVGDSRVLARLAAMDGKDQYLSVISLGEMAYGAARLQPGTRRRELEEWIAQAERDFADHVLPVDRDIAHL